MYCASIETLFSGLARFYGWTMNDIADMTMEQCNAAMKAACENYDPQNTDSGHAGWDGNLHFSTREEWEFWKQTRG